MLEPNRRELLLESLRPPDGHELDWAVGTTYSLDLMALLTAPVAFAFADWQDGDGRPRRDPLTLLKAVRQYASQLCIFCQADKIHVPPVYQPLFASLEDSVVPALAPRGGSFHPKLWFLRFVRDEEVLYRLLCLSRNLTFDRSWDTSLCLEGPLSNRVNAHARNHPLGEFVAALPGMAQRELAPVWKQRLEQLAHEVRRVAFDVPEPFDELVFHPLGHAEKSRWPFARQSDRLLVISPFVDAGLLGDLAESATTAQLVSRDESLAEVPASKLESFEDVWLLDDTAEPEPADVEGHDDATAELPLVGLHAKVYVAELGQRAHVWTGSANATRTAFERNVEFLVELQGKRKDCGVDAVLGRTAPASTRPACSICSGRMSPATRRKRATRTRWHSSERLTRWLARSLPASLGPIANRRWNRRPASRSV